MLLVKGLDYLGKTLLSPPLRFGKPVVELVVAKLCAQDGLILDH